MDKKTRVLNCIDRKPIDKVPVSFWHHFKGEDKVGRQCIAAHKRLYDEANLDFVKMMADSYDIIGLETKVCTPSDWARLKFPSMNSPFVQEQVDRVLWMREAIKDEACVFYIIFSGFSFMTFEFGHNLIDAHLHDDEARPHLLPAINAMGDFVAELSSTILERSGATGLLLSMGNNTVDRFTAQEYKDWLQPQDFKLLGAANEQSDYNIIHLCGYAGVSNNLELWRDYEGAVIHWDQHTDRLSIPEAKHYFTGARALMSGFNNKSGTLLETGTVEQIKACAKDFVRSGGQTGFILGADCSISSRIPYSRLRAVVEATEELAE